MIIESLDEDGTMEQLASCCEVSELMALAEQLKASWRRAVWMRRLAKAVCADGDCGSRDAGRLLL